MADERTSVRSSAFGCPTTAAGSGRIKFSPKISRREASSPWPLIAFGSLCGATRQPVRSVNRIRPSVERRAPAMYGRGSTAGGSRSAAGPRSFDRSSITAVSQQPGGRRELWLTDVVCRSGLDGRGGDGRTDGRQLGDREIKSRGVDRSISPNDRRVSLGRRVQQQHLQAMRAPSAGRRRGLMKL